MGSIVVNKVGKAYKKYPNRLARFAEWFLPGARSRHELKWVLRDISFSVQPGEAVGIIGLNGAGKSTLLKIITGTTQASTGDVTMQGRVAAMLELGMGFHPDFTGRQNAVMAGQLLGLSVEEIQRLMPEIEAFAEIGDYIDQPVRVYSSGMQMRLAFSVATAVRPDILIVDEALSVGDTYFQHKSFQRIREFREHGTTLLLVSHDKSAIQSVCDRAVLLSKGGVAMEGDPEVVMNYYNALLVDSHAQVVTHVKLDDGSIQTNSGDGRAKITELSFFDESGKKAEVVGVGRNVTLEVKAEARDFLPKLVFGYLIKDRLGLSVFGTNTELKNVSVLDAKQGSVHVFRFSFPVNIGPGSYSVSVALTGGATHSAGNFEWRDRAMVFTVVNMDHDEFSGSSWLDPVVDVCEI